VTLKDLQKLIQSQQQLAAGSGSAELSKLLRLLREFWLWDSTKHKERDIIQKGNCCFNHIIGLPRKNGVKKPIFMAWLCIRGDDYKESQMCIVTGPNQDIAIKLIKGMKALFETLGVSFDSKETVLELNGCSIEAYPSNHIDAFRSLTNPKFILIEEGDFFRKNEQDDVRHVSERYIAKSDPFIVMVSTLMLQEGYLKR
jgi:hypothetical protein